MQTHYINSLALANVADFLSLFFYERVHLPDVRYLLPSTNLLVNLLNILYNFTNLWQQAISLQKYKAEVITTIPCYSRFAGVICEW